MKWYSFGNTLINLDNVICIDRKDEKLEVFVAGNSKLISKTLIFKTIGDCKDAFETLIEYLNEKKM